MRTIVLLLLAALLFVLMTSGVVLNLLLVFYKLTGSIDLVCSKLWLLYITGGLVVIGLLRLFVSIGGKR